MSALLPLETLYDASQGTALPLPDELTWLYGGGLRLPWPPEGPYVYGNFVATLDGVVSLNVPGRSGGKEISGFNGHDRLVMGLLRAAADAVVVGAGTLRAVPHHLWTAAYAFPELAGAYDEARRHMGKEGPPLNVIVTARGEIDTALPVFQDGTIPVLIVTTRAGAGILQRLPLPRSVAVVAGPDRRSVDVQTILDAVAAQRQNPLILLEGGPHLMSDFIAAGRLADLFLTVAPQVAGRDPAAPRPGLVEGQAFAPDHPVWATLTGLKRAESHLFLRYSM